MKRYCEDVARSIRRFGEDVDVFKKDTDYMNSVSMSIQQIGELSKGLSDEFRDNTQERVPWNKIKGMRNMYAHAYSKMNAETIWNTATVNIPTLLRFCNDVLANEHGKKPSLLGKLNTYHQTASNTPHQTNANPKNTCER